MSKSLWLVGSRENCRGDECEASIYGKAYTEGSDPFEAKELEKRFTDHEFRLADVENAMKYVLNTLMPPIQKRRPIGFGVKHDD